MSVQVEKLEKNMAKLTIEVSADDLEKALQNAYMKQKKQIQVPGFRKGKVPRQMIEKMYGPAIFYDEAMNELVPKAYADAYDEADVEITSTPQITIVQIEKGKPFIFEAEVAVKPEVTLGEYKGLEVTEYSLEVSEDEINDKLNAEAQKNAREVSVERPVQDGDQVILDFNGTVDGEAFEGGSGENYPLIIGSRTFIPGFEDQLIGAELEKEVEVNVTFPTTYQVDELQGKPAVFKCVIHEIKAKEVPEIDDEFASEVSEFDTLEEYKASLVEEIKKDKERTGKSMQQSQVVAAAVKNAEMEIPEAMIATEARQMYDNFMQQLTGQGLSADQYFQYTGTNEDTLAIQMRPEAESQIKQRLTLQAIAEAENIEVTDERLEEELAKMAEAYGMELDKVKELMGDADKEAMKRDLATQAAVDFMVENAVAKPEETIEEAAAALDAE